MMKNIRKNLCVLVPVLLSASLISCERMLQVDSPYNNGIVGVYISNTGQSGVKSASSSGMEKIGSCPLDDIDGHDFMMDSYISDYYGLPFFHETKGSIITDDGAEGSSSINATNRKFTFNGWLGSENRYPNNAEYEDGGSAGRVNYTEDADNYHFISNSVATKDAGVWTLAPSAMWRNGVPTTFWSWYPVTDAARQMSLPSDTASDDEQACISFSYRTPLSAAGQNDLIFAYNKQTVTYDDNGRTNDDELVGIHFYHALAAIRFDVSGAIKNGVTVNSVFFEDVVVEGSCNVSGSSNGTESSPGLVSFDWSPGETESTVSQEVSASDFTEDSLDGTTSGALMSMGSDKFFFMIPQTVIGKVKIGITYTRADGSVHSKTSELSHDAWKPGKIYTYKLNPAADSVDVEILENVSANIKSNVRIKNTGNVYEYLRTAIKGNWVVSDGTNETLAGSWTFNSSDFTGLNTGLGNGWALASDGFFYSNSKVAPGESLELFNSFTAPTPPLPNATLNIYILSQAIAAGGNENWAEAVTALR